MCPLSFANDDVLKSKLDAFNARQGTTHYPAELVRGANSWKPTRPDGSVDPADRPRPFIEPVETEAVMRLVGVSA